MTKHDDLIGRTFWIGMNRFKISGPRKDGGGCFARRIDAGGEFIPCTGLREFSMATIELHIGIKISKKQGKKNGKIREDLMGLAKNP